jgi:hypothetical protein
MSAGELPPRDPVVTSRRQWLGFAALFGAIGTVVALGAVLVIGPMLTCACTPVSQTPDITSPVEGVVVSVDAAALGDVRGFTLRPANSAFSLGFALGTLENPTQFPPGHLAEHQATSQPVRVYFRSGNGIRTVYRLEDAAPTGS